MIKNIRFKILIILVFCLTAVPAHAVTRDELINKCIEAGQHLKNRGLDSAVKLIEDKQGPYVWHDNINYLFLMDTNGKMLAHPFKPELKKSASLLDKTDTKGSSFFVEFVKVAKSKAGMGWVRYMWPLPGKAEPIQKYTFIYRIPDTDYFIGSGFYVIRPGEYY